MNQLHVCLECGRSFSSALALGSHKKVHTQTPTRCDQCGQIFPSAQACAGHMNGHMRIIYHPKQR